MLAVAALPGFSVAQDYDEDIPKLEEVVVTATRKMKMLDTPASISIITAKELEEMGAKNIAEALRKIPGVIDKSAKQDAIAIRGTQSSMAGGPVILIDGVPQKIGDYRYDQFGFIPVSQIERIEVLRSAGIAYGPGAARGVINVITKKGRRDRPFEFDAGASYGSWDTHNEYAGFWGGIDRWDYFLNAANYSTKGYEDEEQDRRSALLRLGYNLSDRTRFGVRGTLMRNEHDTAYGLWKKKWQMESYRRDIHFPRSETDPTLVWHNEDKQDVSSIALEFSHNGSKLFVASNASWTGYDEEYKDLHQRLTSPKKVYFDDKGQNTYTLTFSGGYHFDLAKVSYTPSIGFNLEDLGFDQRRTYPNDPTKNTDRYDFEVDERQYGFIWDNEFLFGETWSLNLGARVDRAEIRFEDKVPNKLEQERTMYSWYMAPSYRLSKKANIYASVGRNFWFPTPRYYAWAAERGGDLNRPEDLRPEESFTYEVGYKHMLNKGLNVALTGFFTRYKDKFASYYDTSGTWRGMKNLGEAEMKGIELEADGRPFAMFGYRIAATYLDAEWTKGQVRIYEHPSNLRVMKDLSGYEIYGIPKYTVMAGVDLYPAQGLKFSLDMNYYGPYYVDYIDRIKYGAKTTFDANISYHLKNWKFWVLGKNILDEEIERVINPTGRLTAANGEYDNAYYIQDGRYIEVGVSCRF
ncbi:MAG: TonB-dependent receptor [Thermoplasmata archaeon]|nr:MAG: TonB-dependent receptor [Thermoplasmata archaeon]